MPDLTIVIPAYKPDFLAAALDSIAAQTDTAFAVFVGDDASPHDLRAVCDRYADRVALRYHRYDRNLGQSDLVAHWNRCVDATGSPWVWLFSDDDVMEPGCVAALRARIAADAGAHDLYHFDVREIDADGEIRREAPPFPPVLPALGFALARFEGRLSSYAPDYVFARDAWQRAGRFEPFPLAWASDDATWVKLSRRGGIATVAGPKVRWRRSGQNITSQHPALAQRKLLAAAAYVAWFDDHLRRAPPADDADPTAATLRAAAWRWLLGQSRHTGARFWPGIGLQASRRLRRAAPGGAVGAMAQTMYWDLRYALKGW